MPVHSMTGYINKYVYVCSESQAAFKFLYFEGNPRSTRPNKENPENLEKNTFISQRSLLLAR